MFCQSSIKIYAEKSTSSVSDCGEKPEWCPPMQIRLKSRFVEVGCGVVNSRHFDKELGDRQYTPLASSKGKVVVMVSGACDCLLGAPLKEIYITATKGINWPAFSGIVEDSLKVGSLYRILVDPSRMVEL